MSVSTNPATAVPVSTLPSTSSSSSSSASSALASQLGPDAFLQLLTTQLQNQDPLNPMDDTQSVAQLAQFSTLQSQQQLQSSFSAFESNFAVIQTAGLIGQTVTVSSADSTGATSQITGTVKSVDVVNGQPEFTMVNSSGQPITGSNGGALQFTTSQIIGIGTGASGTGG
jgi:flagellar basal-body rod modification protein FlgD